MANHAGYEGVMKVGTVQIGEAKGWQFKIARKAISAVRLGDDYEVNKYGTASVTGTITAFMDTADTAQESLQSALAGRTNVTLNLYPTGAISGQKYWTGSVLITGIAIDVSDNDSMEMRNFDFQSTGSFAESTVP